MTRAEARIAVCPMALPGEPLDELLAAVARQEGTDIEALDKETAWQWVRARWRVKAHELRRQLGGQHDGAGHGELQGQLRGWLAVSGVAEERVLEGKAAAKWLTAEAGREVMREQARAQGLPVPERKSAPPRRLTEAQYRMQRRDEMLRLVGQPGWERFIRHAAAYAWAAYRALEHCTADERTYYQAIVMAVRAAVRGVVDDICLGDAAEDWLRTVEPKEQGMAKEAGHHA